MVQSAVAVRALERRGVASRTGDAVDLHGLRHGLAAKYPGVRRHRLHYPGVATDDRARADDRVATQDLGSRVNRHIVTDGRVALVVSPRPPRRPGAMHAQRTQRHTLIHLDVIADVRG